MTVFTVLIILSLFACILTTPIPAPETTEPTAEIEPTTEVPDNGDDMKGAETGIGFIGIGIPVYGGFYGGGYGYGRPYWGGGYYGHHHHHHHGGFGHHHGGFGHRHFG